MPDALPPDEEEPPGAAALRPKRDGRRISGVLTALADAAKSTISGP